MKRAKLRGIMAEKNITQKKLAELIGVSERTMSSYINMHSDITTASAIRICEVLGISDPETKCDIFLSGSSQN